MAIVTALRRATDHRELWEGLAYEDRCGTAFQSIDITHKRTHKWDVMSSNRKCPYRKHERQRRIFNAKGKRPRYKNINRQTVREPTWQNTSFQLKNPARTHKKSL